MPRVSELFTDVRGDDRTMRITLHPERPGRPAAVVVSVWMGPVCRASFRMDPEDLDRLMATLAESKTALRAAPTAPGSADSVVAAVLDAGTPPSATGLVA
ncbi:hypothetical protein Raf01_52090 [Rugosimonospora africana]|uniref:Uncharacterized protein n=2 Tax=Rugosimonospora africana TaxID=556532 RepID=A0A8J3VS98_9ACTN|nr:hypothetical protein Raf01_52090 [Rugosimonospora africana]